jgi:hypothetical protein
LVCLVCVTGLLNKMAESNVETITAELATIYRSVARSVSSQIFCEEVLTTYARGNEQLRSVQLSDCPLMLMLAL